MKSLVTSTVGIDPSIAGQRPEDPYSGSEDTSKTQSKIHKIAKIGLISLTVAIGVAAIAGLFFTPIGPFAALGASLTIGLGSLVGVTPLVAGSVLTGLSGLISGIFSAIVLKLASKDSPSENQLIHEFKMDPSNAQFDVHSVEDGFSRFSQDQARGAQLTVFNKVINNLVDLDSVVPNDQEKKWIASAAGQTFSCAAFSSCFPILSDESNIMSYNSDPTIKTSYDFVREGNGSITMKTTVPINTVNTTTGETTHRDPLLLEFNNKTNMVKVYQKHSSANNLKGNRGVLHNPPTLIPVYDRIAESILKESKIDIRPLLGSTAPLTEEKSALVHQFIQTGTADVLSKIKNQDMSLNQLLMALIPYITEVQIEGVDADNMTLYQTRAMSLLTALFDYRKTDPSLWTHVRNKLFEYAS